MKENLKISTNSLIRLFLFLALVSISFSHVNGQEKEKKDIDPEEFIARKSAYRSTILPGWGQATNGGAHWFKVPIIYGGIGALSYMAHFNHKKFKCFEKGYRLTLNNLYFEDCDGYTTTSALKRGMETYHQRRDLFVILTAGFYALNILDAYVWAHLNQFDDSDDLSLRLYPSYANIAGQNLSLLTLNLRF